MTKRAQILEMVAQGLSPRAIAEKVGCVRNYVYTIAKSAGGVHQERSAKRRARPRQDRPQKARNSHEIVAMARRVRQAELFQLWLHYETWFTRGQATRALRELQPTGCKYPIGDPEIPGFHFCNEPRRDGRSSYCSKHHAVCYEPAQRVEYASL